MASTLTEALNFAAPHLLESTRMLRLASCVCLAGALSAGAAAWAHTRESRDPARRARLPMLATLGLLVLGIAASAVSVAFRWREVNHFPSQTMSEVLVMSGFACLVSLFVLHFALRWREHGPGWAVVGDALMLVVFVGVFLVYFYSSTLSTAQRDLPPALQSYWFAPHLSSLIFSYATLTIAGLIAVIYFCIRFWSVLRHGGKSAWSQVLILAGLALVPFTHVVTLPILLLVGAALWVVGGAQALPRGERLSELETKLEAVSHRAFAVGFPFLTAGLFMGAFWAQEAWANYWGWDSKENSALITWLVYVVYIHLRMLGGYRGEKAMALLVGGALSVFVTFQIFGYLPDSQKSLHRYTDDGVVPMEGQAPAARDQSAMLEPESAEKDR